VEHPGAIVVGLLFLTVAAIIATIAALILRFLSRDDPAPPALKWTMIAGASIFLAGLPALAGILLIALAFCECPNLGR
jgi:hypothetical protein